MVAYHSDNPESQLVNKWEEFRRYLGLLKDYDFNGIQEVASSLPRKAAIACLAPQISAKDIPLVYTVDAFQGNESDVFILDLVLCDRTGFLRDKGRMKVAFSWARDNFIVVGSQLLLGDSRYVD